MVGDVGTETGQRAEGGVCDSSAANRTRRLPPRAGVTVPQKVMVAVKST